MPELHSVLFAALAIIVNAAVVYGVISTKIEWIRADVARLEADVRDVRARVIRCDAAAGAVERGRERDAFTLGGIEPSR